MQVTRVEHRGYTHEALVALVQFRVQHLSQEVLRGALAVANVHDLVEAGLSLDEVEVGRHVV